MFGLRGRLGVEKSLRFKEKSAGMTGRGCMRLQPPETVGVDRRARGSISILLCTSGVSPSRASVLWSQGGWFWQQMEQFASVQPGSRRLNSESRKLCLMTKKLTFCYTQLFPLPGLMEEYGWSSLAFNRSCLHRRKILIVTQHLLTWWGSTQGPGDRGYWIWTPATPCSAPG